MQPAVADANLWLFRLAGCCVLSTPVLRNITKRTLTIQKTANGSIESIEMAASATKAAATAAVMHKSPNRKRKAEPEILPCITVKTTRPTSRPEKPASQSLAPEKTQ